MELTPEQKEALYAQTTAIQNLVGDVAASDEVQKITKSVSQKTKLIVYIIGDTLIGLGLLVPQAAVVAGFTDVVRVVALSGLLGAAGAFILTMFGIYKSGK